MRIDETILPTANLTELESNSDFSEDVPECALDLAISLSSTSVPRENLQVHPLASLHAQANLFKPPSPNLKPLLTSRADTPMLGAQARAAELAAASAAKQRQVSRELEERQLPPNPAVFLSAFTKPQPTISRNKGNKNWKPLILDDIDENSDTPTSDPATCTPNHADRLTAKEASDKKIPTAPRAMVAGRSLSTVVAYPQPSKAQPSPNISMPIQGYGPTHHGGFPYPEFTQNLYLPQPMFLGGMPFNDITHGNYGSMMVPDDISPTKQEQKFSMLENIPFPHMMQGQEPHFPTAQHGTMQHDDPFSHGTPQPFGHDQQYMWDDSGHNAYYPGYQMPFQVQPQPMGGGYENGSDGAYAHMPQVLVHTSTLTPARIDSAANQNAPLPIRRSSGQQPPRDSPLRYQEPYDTERAMKDCVNKLKEKAKDGKTVLHNPNVYKEPPQRQITEPEKSIARLTVRKPSDCPQPPVPWDVRPKDSIREPNEWEVMPPPDDESVEGPTIFTNNIGSGNDPGNVKPAPGLPFPSTFSPPQLPLEKIDAIDSSAPQVGSIEWMQLAPMTTGERDRVRRRMALAAKSVTNEGPLNRIATGQDKEDLAETQKWFHTDARGERLLRQQVDLSAQAHASTIIANIKARNGGELPELFQDGKDDGVAATLILGNVACNLQTYLVGDRKSIEQRRNFHKVKSVPDWCTERGGMALGGLGGGDSYFDGAAGGFYGAPVRVARDPRFRPQVKEGMKVKPEEEWKNRHEMYGRRIM